MGFAQGPKPVLAIGREGGKGKEGTLLQNLVLGESRKRVRPGDRRKRRGGLEAFNGCGRGGLGKKDNVGVPNAR